MTDSRPAGRIPRPKKSRKPPQSPRKISFIEALKEKYCSNDDDEFGNGFVIKFVTKPKDNSSAELGYLRNVVLDKCRLSHLGLPPSGLANLCPNIIDLDLSNNHLSCSDCLTLLHQLPLVKFFNITGNPLINCQNDLQQWDKPLPGVENLVMNRTGIRWKEAMEFCSHLPTLKELHVCDNGYMRLEAPEDDCLTGLECLRLNGNFIKRWEEIWTLHGLPSLKSLVLSKNPLENIFYVTVEENRITSQKAYQDADNCNKLISEIEKFLENITESACDRISERFAECLNKDSATDRLTSDSTLATKNNNSEDTYIENKTDVLPFKDLRELCISDTHLSGWDHLEALTQFPVLKNVRLKGIRLAGDISAEERRKLFVASLPTIVHLNGSEITITERDKAERHYIRYFSEQDVQPCTLQHLQKKHGEVEKLVDVDLSYGFQEWAELDIIYQGQLVEKVTVHAVDPVGKLKKYIQKLIGSRFRYFEMYHNPISDGHSAEYRPGEEPPLCSLRLDSLPMSRYNFMDGDQIIVIDEDIKNRKPQFRHTTAMSVR